jgi:hypothetical protein
MPGCLQASNYHILTADKPKLPKSQICILAEMRNYLGCFATHDQHRLRAIAVL